MKQRLLVLIMILMVVLIGAGVWFWLNQDKVSTVLYGNSNTNVAVTNTAPANTNAALANLSLPNEQRGGKDMDARGTVAGTELHFSSVSKADMFEGDPAGGDNMFIVVYFDSLPGDKVLPVKRGIEAGEIKLLTNLNPGVLTTTKIASTAFQNDRGYVKFTVPKRATEFRLFVGPAGAGQEIKLPL